MKHVVVDAKGAIVGRLATFVAKQALLGFKVSVVNAEHAVFTGVKEGIVEKYHIRSQVSANTMKGPYYSRLPDRFLRRIIRGMVGHKTGRGREAYARILCYRGVPEVFKTEELVKVPAADMSRSKSMRFVTINDVCKALGAKV